jgi:hypothetical protein
MKCFKCASVLDERATFCSNCSYRIGTEEEDEDLKYLSEKERNELRVLDDPNVKYLTMGLFSLIFGSKIGRNKSRMRVVKLRTKMRMIKKGLDPKKNAKEYKKIQTEESDRFNKRVE